MLIMSLMIVIKNIMLKNNSNRFDKSNVWNNYNENDVNGHYNDYMIIMIIKIVVSLNNNATKLI